MFWSHVAQRVSEKKIFDNQLRSMQGEMELMERAVRDAEKEGLESLPDKEEFAIEDQLTKD